MPDITFNGNVLDLASADEAQTRSNGVCRSNFIYLQGVEVLTNEQKGLLEEIGVEIREYVSEKTYLCKYTPQDLSPVQALGFVKLADVYHPSLKTSADLKTSLSHYGDQRSYTVDLLLHESAQRTPAQLSDDLVATGQVLRGDVTTSSESNKIRLTVRGSTIPQLETYDDVNRIEEAEIMELANEYARKVVAAEIVLNGTEYDGSGQLIAVADTGFDRGSAEADIIHPAFQGKVKKTDCDRPRGHWFHQRPTRSWDSCVWVNCWRWGF